MSESDEALAERLAAGAGAILMALRADGPDGAALGQAGDEQASAWLMRELRAARPADAILNEEERDDAARLTASRVWIIDPLDGTREYGERREDWAVHVALAIDGVATLGAVALPALGQLLSSSRPLPQPARDRPPRMLVSRSRPATQAGAVAARLGAELIMMGSAGAKAMAVVRGLAEIYLHIGGQYEWDSCAPAAVARAAGLHVSRADGSPLVYNSVNPYLPDLLICRPEWSARVLELTRATARLRP